MINSQKEQMPSRTSDRFFKSQVSSRSHFEDNVWELDVAQATVRKNRLNWNIRLGRHGSLTDARHSSLLWCCKAMMYIMLTGDYGLYRMAKPTTVINTFGALRQLLQWMASKSVLSFDALTLEHIRTYRNLLEGRPSNYHPKKNSASSHGKTLSDSHRRLLMAPIRILLALESDLPQPCGDREEILELSNVIRDTSDQGLTKKIPDEIAIPLFQAALHWVEDYGVRLAHIYGIAAQAERSSTAKMASDRGSVAARAVKRHLQDHPLVIEYGSQSADLFDLSLQEINSLVLQLEIACYILLSGLVGQRVSEVGSLRRGCLSSAPTERGQNLLLVNGKLFKTSKGAKSGAPWQWVAGWDDDDNPVRKAIETLEAIRSAETIDSPWLFIGSWGRRDGSAKPVSAEHHNRRLNVFAQANGITGWRFASHQFRKTFARFVTKRDFTGLVALKNHFGHVSIQMTEQYGYWDQELIQDVLDAEVEQDYEALDQILAATVLAGRLGERIAKSNERFRGIAGEEARRIEIESLRTEISDDKIVVVRNDYGYCIFMEEQAACGGARWKVGVATCVNCPNFIITQAHMPWWQREVETHRETIDLVTFPFLSGEAQSGIRGALATAERIVEELNVKEAGREQRT